MCFDFLSQGYSEGLVGSWVLPDLSYSPGRALLKSLGLLIRGLPGARLPCPGTRQWDHKTDTHSGHYWLGFAIGADLGEQVGWCHKLAGVPHIRGHLALLWSYGEDARWKHLMSPVGLLHPFSTAAALGWFLGIPVPSSFALTLREAEVRQMLTEVTLLNTQQWTFTWEKKIWFSSCCSNGQNLQIFPLIWGWVWGLMPALILKGSPLAWLHIYNFWYCEPHTLHVIYSHHLPGQVSQVFVGYFCAVTVS